MKYLAVLLTIIICLGGCKKQDISTIYSDTANEQSESVKNEIYYDNGEIKRGELPQREKIDPNDGMDVVNSNVTNEYEVVDSIESTDYNFSDAVYMNDSIIATDKKGNQLVILNNDLKVISTIGTFGSGNVEFLSPVAIDKDENNNLYILDGGNCRIQVLDSKYNYCKEIRLEFLEDYRLAGMNLGFIVDNSGEFAYFSETYQGILLCIDLNTGKIDKLEEYSSGEFTKDNEYVYYIKNLTYTGDSTSLTMRTEEVFLYKICGKDIISKVRLYDNQQSGGILLINNSLYYMCTSRMYMMEYDLEGKYISTPYDGLLSDADQVNEEAYEEGVFNHEKFINAVKGKLYSTTYNIKQGSKDDIIVIYNCIDIGEINKGGAIGILRKVKSK
jgi:hypothetical protein